MDDDVAGTVENLLHRASSLSSLSLDLSQKNIKHLPEDFPLLPNLECLYLKGNELTLVPDKLFSHCPNLRWLDLRYNQLKTLPPDVQNLHCLRTLLLEGNQITSLPLQLGRLSLTGLSLAGNPLEFPPVDVQQKGVKAVLRYLREFTNEDYNEGSSSEEEYSNVGSNFRLPVRKHSLTTAGDQQGDKVSSQHELLMKQATLHKIPQASRHYNVHPLHSRQAGSSMERKSRKKKTSQPGPDKELAKQMNEMYLEEWRDSTRRMQMKASLIPSTAHPRASAIAPYATSHHQHAATNKLPITTPSRVNPLEMNTQGATDDDESSSLHQLRVRPEQDSREGWVEQIAQQLIENRKGRIPPSQDLANAERKLAEALNSRREYQARQIREYRLRAFTADAI